MILLTACAGHRSNEVPAHLIPEGYLPSDYKSQIMNYLKHAMFDFDSIKNLSIEQPKVATCKYNWSQWGVPRGARMWVVDVWFNAKNKLGGYTGINLHRAYFKDGLMVNFI